MIKVQDWIATIPDEDKHIAYVGEGNSEQRTFLLCGNGWENYKNWEFHLDMAFDPVSITTHDSRQVVQTTVNSNKMTDEAAVITDQVTTQETYTVDNVQVNNNYLTDIAPLLKSVTDDGILLTWTVLRQHTVLPGKLWATIRAVHGGEQRIKKSAIMVFEVEAAICAIPAAVPPISEFEQMETQLGELRRQAEEAADSAIRSATTATIAADSAQNAIAFTMEAAEQTQAEAAKAVEASIAAAQHHASVLANVALAEAAAAKAETQQKTAATHAASAAISAQGAQVECSNATKAAQQCSSYAQQCEEYAEAAQHAAAAAYRRINVRDYGAKGDGVSDDRSAIIAAFAAAKKNLPCEVYFPAGIYGISNGITVEMAYGTGGLIVRGAGSDITTIKYLDSYTPDQPGNMWYAIRIWPVGRPDTLPGEEDYLHDISYTGLTVYDPDPCAHAWHTAKGDPSNEETHGIDIHCCKGVSVTDCQFITVGDEAIDICFCHDVVVMNNRLVGSPGAGPGGGAISIGDGCKGVVVCGNTVNGSAPDETLDDGTVITKSNYGIALESLFYPVQDVTVTGNTVLNMHGKGINLGAINEGASITNAIISDNVIGNCDLGIRLNGTLPKDNIKITNNVICDCKEQAIWTCAVGNLTICGNTIRNIKGNYAIHTTSLGSTSRQLMADNVLENVEGGGIFCAGTVTVKDCVFNGVGVAATIPDGNVYGIHKYGGVATVAGCTFKDVRMLTLKACLQNIDYIDNTNIEVINKTTGVADGGGLASTGSTKRISGGHMLGRIEIKQDDAIVQGVRILYIGSAHAISVMGSRVAVVGCVVESNGTSNSYKAIHEASGYNYNLFANNIVNRGITINGAQSLAVNNVDTRVTA